jgi:exo-1,4-beta-D-glucosaminidase
VPEDYARFTPESLLWPLDTTYIEYHGEYNTGFQHVKKLMRYADEFGPSTSTHDAIMKSELYQALANSFNMEYCREHEFQNSGLLIWQFNDIWPCVSWSIVDWYGTPKPSYYYLKRAARPLHISADFERYRWMAGETFAADIYVVNDVEGPGPGPGRPDCTYEAKLIGAAGKTIEESSGPVPTAASGPSKVGRVEFKIPAEMSGKTFFVSVRLRGKDGTAVSDALYPIAVTSPGHGEDYANIFAGMGSMPPVPLGVTPAHPGITMENSANGSCDLTLSNPTDKLAFFVRVRLLEESERLRTDYSDNYVSLLPGESKTVRVTVQSTMPESLPSRLRFEVSGWNTPASTCDITIMKN